MWACALNSPETPRIQPLICGLAPELQVFLQRYDVLDQEKRSPRAIERNIADDCQRDQPRHNQIAMFFHRPSPVFRAPAPTLRRSAAPGRFAKPSGIPR